MIITKSKHIYIKLLIIKLLVIPTGLKTTRARQANDSLYIVTLLNEAEQYKNALMFSKSDSLYRKSIRLAKNKYPKLYYQSIISLAELNRKTGYFNEGKNILLNLPENMEPELKVRKYDRLAAIY
ncbi:MAG: hypothetical protein D6707_12810, partial [Bacteroidetes bacterium]